jgi:hypothetical protein
MKRCILLIFSFVCFATFVFQNLPARGRKTEKIKEMALAEIRAIPVSDSNAS